MEPRKEETELHQFGNCLGNLIGKRNSHSLDTYLGISILVSLEFKKTKRN